MEIETKMMLTNIKCHHCGKYLYVCPNHPSEHWCSNPKCHKDAFGLGLKIKEANDGD